MPAARAASAREAPSSTSAKASIRRAARASRHRPASRRRPPASSSRRVIATVIAPPPIGHTADQRPRAARGATDPTVRSRGRWYYQSGGRDRDRRINRSGNPRAWTAIIQLAWLWLRYQPGSALAGWFRGRVGALAGRTRRIAIVAMARKLLIALWKHARTGLL